LKGEVISNGEISAMAGEWLATEYWAEANDIVAGLAQLLQLQASRDAVFALACFHGPECLRLVKLLAKVTPYSDSEEE
jgi:hypothetical protein